MAPRRFPIGTVLFLLFSGFTLLEIYLLVLLTRATSLTFTILLAIGTALLGSALARQAGVSVVVRIQKELAEGRVPARPLLDGVLVLVGGAFLIAPGIITDALGITLLFPPTRALYAGVLMRWIGRRVALHGAGTSQTGPGGFRLHVFSSRGPSAGTSSTASGATSASDSPPESGPSVLDPDAERRVREWREQIRSDSDTGDHGGTP